MRFAASSLVSLWLLLPISALAGELSPAEPTAEPSFDSPTAAPLARLALAVAAVSATGWALATWAKRRRRVDGDAGCRIEILASRSLGPRHQLSLLEVAGHRLLIGTGGDTITTLADLSADLSFEDQLEREMPNGSEEGSRSLVATIGRFEGLDG